MSEVETPEPSEEHEEVPTENDDVAGVEDEDEAEEETAE
jgi:hypothetical protein